MWWWCRRRRRRPVALFRLARDRLINIIALLLCLLRSVFVRRRRRGGGSVHVQTPGRGQAARSPRPLSSSGPKRRGDSRARARARGNGPVSSSGRPNDFSKTVFDRVCPSASCRVHGGAARPPSIVNTNVHDTGCTSRTVRQTRDHCCFLLPTLAVDQAWIRRGVLRGLRTL